MKQYAEIRRIITEELGFSGIDAYRQWIDQVRPTINPTPEIVARLSPDEIDCPAFWKVCEELFGEDPVCNVAVAPRVGALPYAIETHMDANRMNLRLAKSFGVTSFLDENAEDRLKTLEVGPGYGSLKNYIEAHTQHRYVAFDVYPRIPGVLRTTCDGLIPRDFVDTEQGTYSYVISSNVFQHLSARQRSAYFRDAERLLHKGGLFIFNMFVDLGNKIPSYLRDADGVAWCDHYGQYTLIPKPTDLQREVASLFDILYFTQRYDNLVNFVCRKVA